MSRLPVFDPKGPQQYTPAIPATRGWQNSKNSRGTPREREEALSPDGYRLKYPACDQATDAELAELKEQVDTKGYVLLWSNLLADFIAFYRSEADLREIPDCFVPYSKGELMVLFGYDEPDPSPNGLRLIHEAKKEGGRVLGDQDGDSR